MKTIEEKAKAYDEALKDMRVIYPNLKGEVKLAVEHAFPQLCESEDERIRKQLINICNEWLSGGYSARPCLADVRWLKNLLEKWQEQKPYCPSNDKLEDAAKEFREKNVPPIEPISDELIDIIKGEFEGFRTLLKKKGIDYEPQRGYWEGFARLFDSSAREYVKEQEFAWSEEDEKMIRLIISILEDEHPNVFWRSDEMESGVYTEELVDLLKRICPSRKLSEEQIYTLERICSNLHLRASDDAPKLDEIIEQLKQK